MNVWKSTDNSPEQALDLPKGSFAADFGFLVQQSVEPDHVLEAALALVETGKSVVAASQAKIIVAAQENGVAFTDWAPLKMI